MAVYVDNMRAQKRVGRINGRWSHLTADTMEELLAFAKKIGLRAAWLQRQCRLAECRPCPHWHFDVTDGMRAKAVGHGAQQVSMAAFGDVIRARRQAMRREAGEPCPTAKAGAQVDAGRG